MPHPGHGNPVLILIGQKDCSSSIFSKLKRYMYKGNNNIVVAPAIIYNLLFWNLFV